MCKRALDRKKIFCIDISKLSTSFFGFLRVKAFCFSSFTMNFQCNSGKEVGGKRVFSERFRLKKDIFH